MNISHIKQDGNWKHSGIINGREGLNHLRKKKVRISDGLKHGRRQDILVPLNPSHWQELAIYSKRWIPATFSLSRTVRLHWSSADDLEPQPKREK